MKEDSRQLHETFIRDIMDCIINAKDFDQTFFYDGASRRASVGSITKRASKFILVFPVIVSTSVSIETAMMISKAVERKCCALLQILFSAAQITYTDDLYGYINKFHKNLDIDNKLTLDDFVSIMDKLEEASLIKITDKDIYEATLNEMKNINYTLSNEFNPVAIDDYVSEKNVYGESTIMLEADKGGKGKGKNKLNNNAYAKLSKRIDDGLNLTDRAMQSIQRDVRNALNRRGAGGGGNAPNLKDTVEYYDKQILSTKDVEKANELLPTNMIVNFIGVDRATGINTAMTGVIGVKAKLYPVDSVDIINRISSKVVEKNGLFNLIRATTREISFFKDLAFAIDKAKLDAVYMADDSNNARLFKLLERRATKHRFTKLLASNDASPITTLVLSDTDVDYLRKYHNIDMNKAFNVRTLFNSYNLMGVVLADESLEICKFMWDDGDNIFETLTFDALEKQSSDNSYKKVINLMSKLNR